MHSPLSDLVSTREAIQRNASTAAAEMEKSITAAKSPACEFVFTKTFFDEARQEAAEKARVSFLSGAAPLPLAGLAVSVKDLFDIEGQVTSAGSAVLSNAPPARADAIAVARLKAAGGVVIGRTNMSEFAFSGVGVNPHLGTPRNAMFGGKSPEFSDARIPGGSSSGAAISVAAGAAFVGLGSDTGGSIRIPAAFNGLVGFKSTARLVPTVGALPLSTTLDTVCAMTRSVRDAVLAHEIIAARRVAVEAAPLAGRRFAVATTLMLGGMDDVVGKAFERALAALRKAGACVDEISLDELGQLNAIQATGGFSPPEAYAWHRSLLATDGDRYDPRVRVRIERGAKMSAADYIDLVHARKRWIGAMEAAMSGYDAVLSPTVPIAPPLLAGVAPGSARDEEFFRINGLLLRNPAVVNMLDGCSISLPCHAAGELSAGLMLWHAALHDDALLSIALQLEPLLQSA